MPTRTRSEVVVMETGRRRVVGSPTWTNRTRWSSEHRCVDTVAVGDNGALTITKHEVRGGVFNGIGNGAHGGLVTEYEYYPNGAVQDIDSSTFYPAPLYSSSSDATYGTRLLRMTNPSRPVVDVPVFVAELRDFPRLFKLAGDTALQKIASANLNFWFGWKILASDLQKFCNFSDIVNKRYAELKRLYEGGLKCTRQLDDVSGTGTGAPIVYTNSGGTYWELKRTYVHKCQIWGHCKWFPTTLPPRTSSEMLALARRAAFGLTIDAATAWELIPFSWLADWSLNIGGYLMANRNIVPATHKDLLIMRHENMTCYTQTNATSDSAITAGQEPRFERERKMRAPVAGASVTAELPYLTLRQLSILGSLAVLKSNGGFAFRL